MFEDSHTLANSKSSWYDEDMPKTIHYGSNIEREQSMSFVAIGCYKGHLIGMADKRSSEKIAGVYCEDVRKSRVQKIWCTNNMIIACVGTNCFYMNDPKEEDQSKSVYLDDIIGKDIPLVSDGEIMCKNIYDYLNDNVQYSFDSVSVITYYIKNGDIFSIDFTFDKDNLKLEKHFHQDWTYTYNGVQQYKTYFSKNRDAFLTTNKNKIRTALKQMNEQYKIDFPNEYDPVGDDWDIYII